MTTILNPDPNRYADRVRDSAVPAPPLARSTWTWAGLVAGVAGTAATLVLNIPTVSKEDADGGVDAVYRTLDNQRIVHAGAALGFVAAYALVLFAVGFSRHVARRSPDGSLLPQVIRLALTAGVGTLIVGFGLKAAAAGGMQGGIDADFYTTTDSTVTALISSQMQWVGWQGAAIAMAATAFGAFRYGIVPRWVGAIGAIFSVFVLAFTVILCLPYSAGIVAPPFLVLLSIALLVSRTHRS